jgi:hypothetical protein
MNSTKDDPPGDPPDAAKGGSEKDPSQTKSSGRAAFDARGNAVWEWRTDETGKFTTEASTTVLKKLEASDLAIEATHVIKPSEQAELKDEAKSGGGFNPYDRGAVNKETKSVQRPAAPTKASAPVPVMAPPASTKGARSLGERIREALEAFRDRRR